MRVFLALGNEKLAAELKYKLQKCGKNMIEIVEQKYHLYSPGSQSFGRYGLWDRGRKCRKVQPAE